MTPNPLSHLKVTAPLAAKGSRYAAIAQRQSSCFVSSRLRVRIPLAAPDEWKTPEDVFDWWMETGVLPGQIRMDELMEE